MLGVGLANVKKNNSKEFVLLVYYSLFLKM
jgi:hypothetical protein